MLARGPLDVAQRATLATDLAKVQELQQDMDHRLEALARSGVAAPASWSIARQSAIDFHTRLLAVLNAERPSADPASLFELGSAALQHALAFDKDLLASLSQLLEQRERALSQRMC